MNVCNLKLNYDVVRLLAIATTGTAIASMGITGQTSRRLEAEWGNVISGNRSVRRSSLRVDNSVPGLGVRDVTPRADHLGGDCGEAGLVHGGRGLIEG